MLARKEEEDFYKHNKNIMRSDKYKKKYAETRLKFGTIGIVSNKIEDKTVTKEKGRKHSQSGPHSQKWYISHIRREVLMRI